MQHSVCPKMTICRIRFNEIPLCDTVCRVWQSEVSLGSMKTGRIIGWTLLALALILISHEALKSLEGEEYRLIALGELWFRLDQTMGTGSLNVTQAFIQRYVWAWLWEGVIQNILTAPAWAVFGVPGLLLAWFCRNRSKSGRFRR
jgi:hypothetical protein